MYCNVQKNVQQHMLHTCLTFRKHIHVQINACVYKKHLKVNMFNEASDAYIKDSTKSSTICTHDQNNLKMDTK